MNVTKQPNRPLKQLLQEKGIKQVELAHALSMSTSYLNQVVQGWTKPSPTTRSRIARTLQVPENQIFSDSGGGEE